MCVVKVVLNLLLTTFATNAFLFPDLKLRTGGASIAKYRIAVMQEEPYLFANGSGYVADLMSRIAESYASRHEGHEFSYEIVPVSSWSQLLARARSSSGQVSFGLVVPSLELSPWSGILLQVSAPTMYTSVKVVSRKGRNMDDDAHPQLRDSMQAVILRKSPLEFVLVRANNYHGPVHAVDSMDDAQTYLRSNYDAALVCSAEIADYLAAKTSEDLQSTCSAKKIPGTSPLYYAFFGRDSKLIEQLNDIIGRLMSNDVIPSIYSKYFSSTRQCLW